MSGTVQVPPLTARQWGTLANRLGEVATRFESIGKTDRADALRNAAAHVESQRSTNRLVTITFPTDAMANDVLETLAYAGIGVSTPEPAPVDESSPTVPDAKPAK